MAGLTLAERDLADTREGLSRWFEHKFGGEVRLSEIAAANRSVGWSSESLLFTAVRGDGSAEYVVRIPPAGGGLYPDYDLEGQTRTQRLLHDHGIATPSPIHYEPDSDWIGAKFLMMPRIYGHTPSEMTYALRGWLYDAGPEVQRTLHDSFLNILAALQRVPAVDAPWLARPAGVGNDAELTWWRDYVRWGTDGAVPDLVTEAFDWLRRNQPAEPDELAVCWGDARFSNVIYDDTGLAAGVLDWEQACLCTAETDVAWWLATRRQTLEIHGITADPELPGFDSRQHLITRFEEMIGRSLVAMDWYEVFAMVRMSCCMLRVKVLLTSTGRGDHVLTKAPVMPRWAIEAIRR